MSGPRCYCCFFCQVRVSFLIGEGPKTLAFGRGRSKLGVAAAPLLVTAPYSGRSIQ